MHVLVVADSSSFLKKHKDQILKVNPSISLTVMTSPSKTDLQKAEVLLPMHNFSTLSLPLLPHLLWVHASSAGVNGIVEQLQNTNVILTNSSGVHPIPIAEQIFSYLLIFSRDMQTTFKNQQKKVWEKENLSVFELHGKTIAIIGLGRIGEKVAEIAQAFQMHILAVKTTRTKHPLIDTVYTLDQLPTVLKQADFVVNCLPGTEETTHVYTQKEFSSMKPTAYFINIGRGVTVNEKDLIQALKKNVIAGAGLDVFEEEPLSDSSPLWEMDNVIITPHHAGKTPEYMNRVIDIFCENLNCYLKKQTLPNEVDKSKGY